MSANFYTQQALFEKANSTSINATYWYEIVGRLIDTPWWKSAPPSDPIELEAWQGRAAMLDALFYEE